MPGKEQKFYLTFAVMRQTTGLVNRSITSLWICSSNKVSFSFAGKTGEELLHEVAARYVEAMKDMDGRKPGPSSILGELQTSKTCIAIAMADM